MSDDRWERVADLYEAAQERPQEERLAFVRQASVGDSGLRREVESLLAQDENTVVVDRPIAAAAHSLLADNAGVQPGSFIGSYRIESLLGVGGMGEVYRATDTNLKRQVAIKVLPASVAGDAERVARFQREAEVLAVLNHPNIAHIHGLEKTDGTIALVMELVEGPTLADRIAKSAIPIDEALTIAKQIAEALDAAHEQGIIHRDLKPANIKVRPDGAVKVLDFGLAKALEPPGATSASMSMSPTITSPAMTQLGIILGTAAYMSPEQARGLVVDRRADIWAFGCVMYEMLVGHHAFEGEDVSDTLATVLKSEPDWKAIPSNVPSAVRTLVEGCLRKDRRERIRNISTAFFVLNQAHAAGSDAPVRSPLVRSGWKQAIFIIASVMMGAAGTTIVLRNSRQSPVAVTRFAINLPAGQQLMEPRQTVAISPDGARVAYTANDRLYLRSMSELEPREISGTQSAVGPAFSPDGQSLAFWAEGTLKRIAITGGSAVPICPVNPAPSGVVWDKSGILFAQARTGVLRVSPNGGKPEVVGAQVDDDSLVYGPQLLPDGDTLLFTVAQRNAGPDIWDKAHIIAQSIKRGERKTLIEGGTDARYVPSGHLVYVVNGTLFAVPFDLAKLAVTAGPVPIVEGIRRTPGITQGGAHFAFSSTGSLVYEPAASNGPQELVLIDQKGQAEPLKLPNGSYSYPRVSRDGKRLAVETSDGKQTNISIYELSGASAPRRLTFGGNNRFPIWSDDGQRVAFQSDRDGDPAVFWQPADGGAAERLTKPEPGTSHTPESWSPSGDAFLFSVAKKSEFTLWMFSVRDRKSTPFDNVRSTISTDAVFSPDGQWVAYQTAESGQTEGTTFVEPYPPDGKKYQIARCGRPLWSHDGTTLFCIPGPGRLAAVTVKTKPTFTFTNPVAVPRGFGVADPIDPRPFDMMSDGRIVGIGAVGQAERESAGSAQIQVVLNWTEELKTRVPTK
jgi:eukaryotic-like serine/threonine-protein kinase